MKRLFLLALFATPAFAADESLLQAGLQVCRNQRNEAADAALNQMAQLVAEVQKLQARVKELEASEKKVEKK